MSQHDMNIANQGFPAFRSDLNDALSALATTSAGTAEPSTTFANQLWYDSTNDLLKMRNSDNDAWITLAYFDQTADEWQLRSAVIQAVDAAGVQIKTDEGTTRIDIQDDGDVSIDSGTLFVDAANNKVGIGETAPATKMHLSGTSEVIRIEDTDTTLSTDQTIGKLEFYSNDASGAGVGIKASVEAIAEDSIGRTSLVFATADDTTNDNEAMRITSSGNLLINSGTNATPGVGDTDSGVSITGTNAIFASRNQAVAESSYTIFANRNTTDGGIIGFYKGGTNIGQIGSYTGGTNRIYIGTGDTGLVFADSIDSVFPIDPSANNIRDNAIDLGVSNGRFDDIYATNGTIQTSDRNEKQDIEELSEAEQRVAVAAKALMRKFRWKDAVAEKGDDARIHFGIIAQDLKAAFEAEGLDAGRYAMFIHSEWWEASTEVPAVEAIDEVLDDDGNVITEAVEAKEAYTRIDTYETEAEAPEGAVKKERMGVRYPELLAFIIAAI